MQQVDEGVCGRRLEVGGRDQINREEGPGGWRRYMAGDGGGGRADWSRDATWSHLGGDSDPESGAGWGWRRRKSLDGIPCGR